jgi:hypothetical protein
MDNGKSSMSRREAMKHAVLGLGVGAVTMSASANGLAAEMSGEAATLLAGGATTIRDLSDRLAAAPRRRDFKTVPMILTSPDQWDSEALNEVLRYSGGPKQVWDNTDLESPWLNLMRNAMNAQIWSFRHPNFLAVSATHGSAHLALYDDYIWKKYHFAKLTKGKQKTNTFILESADAYTNPVDFNDPDGVFSPHDNSIVVLQKRGAVFLACHNEIWELTMGLHAKGDNPDHLTHPQMAAEFTNHLIPGAVLTPGIVGTLPELELAGYQYAK